MRFGRSRVQDRPEVSDVETVIEEPASAFDQSAPSDAPEESEAFGDTPMPDTSMSEDMEVYQPARFIDSPERAGATEPEAIDALRAATTAADARTTQLSPDQVAEIERLHEVKVEAERRARRVLPKPGAGRRLHDARTEESDALHMLGFTTFEEFATAHSSPPADDDQPAGAAATIARIAEMLTKIGIDPSDDPLEAARRFLMTNVEAPVDSPTVEDPMVASPIMKWAIPPAPAADEANPTMDNDEELRRESAALAAHHEANPTMDNDEELRRESAALAAHHEANPTMDNDEELRRESAALAAHHEANPTMEDEHELLQGDELQGETETPAALDGEPTPTFEDLPWVPAAQLPPQVAPRATNDRDDEVVDRWISAEARAERMHAEVDRAQAELVSLLARSADLEQTAVARADERDDAHAELEQAQERVAELEQSIARSDAEREEIERSLSTSRDRIAELEDIVVEREQACTEAARDRASALDLVAELETNLAARTAELEQARATVSELEAELTAQAAHLDQSRGELDTARVDVDELRTELETTRRSLDALDEHAEAIEAELAEARRKADSPETRRELEAVLEELTTARTELGELEARRTETETTLSRDRAELEQLQHELTTTRDATEDARSELSAARNAFEATSAHVEAAERAREAITIDAADVLARAEAEAANLLERATRDAEAIRQEALLESGGTRPDEGDAIPRLVDQVAKLERKLAKQRRRLDRIAGDPLVPGPEATKRPKPKAETPDTSAAEIPSPSAAEIIASAEQEAIEIRRAARQDREQFRDELVGLLTRLVPIVDDDA